MPRHLLGMSLGAQRGRVIIKTICLLGECNTSRTAVHTPTGFYSVSLEKDIQGLWKKLYDFYRIKKNVSKQNKTGELGSYEQQTLPTEVNPP